MLAFAARHVKKRAEIVDVMRCCCLALFTIFVMAGSHAATEPSVRSQSEPRARIVVADDLDAVAAFNPRPERVEELFNRGLLAFTEKPTREEAWRSLVSYRTSSPRGCSPTTKSFFPSLLGSGAQ